MNSNVEMIDDGTGNMIPVAADDGGMIDDIDRFILMVENPIYDDTEYDIESKQFDIDDLNNMDFGF